MPPPPRNKFASDSLAATAAPVLDLDALYADLFDGSPTPTDKIPDSVLSKNETYYLFDGPLTPTNEILDSDLFEDEASPCTFSGDHYKSGSDPARVQVTVKDSPDPEPIKPSSSEDYYLFDTRLALALRACMEEDEEEEDEWAIGEEEATDEEEAIEEEAEEDEEDEFDINNLPLYPKILLYPRCICQGIAHTILFGDSWTPG